MKYNKKILKMYLKLIPVQIFLCISGGLGNIVNGFIIGNNLSPTAMIALGYTGPLIIMLTSIASIFSSGSGILCGRYMGKGEVDGVNATYSNALYSSVFLGGILTVVLFVFAEPVAMLLGANNLALADTTQYVRGLSFSVIPSMMIPTLMTFLQMCNKSTFSLISTLFMAFLNAVFSYIAIHIAHTGIFGVALSTSLSKILTVLLLFGYIAVKKNLVRFNKNSFSISLIREMIVYGVPASFAGVLYSIRNVFLNTFANNVGGPDAVNALAILSSVTSFYDWVPLACINISIMLISVFVGERDSNSVKQVVYMTMVLGGIMTAIKVILNYILRYNIAISFGAAGDVIGLTVSLLTFYAYSSFFNSINVSINSSYANFGRTTYINISYLINCIISPLFSCIVLTKYYGINAIWYCYTFAEFVNMAYWYLVGCIRKKGIATSIDDILDFDESFDLSNKYTITINSMEEVVDVSRSIQSFCKEHGIDDRRSMLSGLCMEEMAGNVVDHGFKKDKKKNHSIDIFVCVENDEVLMRMRDDCIPFDPQSKLKIVTDDPLKNIGIKMVNNIAKEMTYQSTFGMNVLIIKL